MNEDDSTLEQLELGKVGEIKAENLKAAMNTPTD